MATVTLTPTTTTTHLRDASFSSYLNGSEEAYVRKLADENFHFGRKKAGEDGEIDVFGAEKYFNEGEPPRVFRNSARNEIAPVKVSSQPPRTPSVCSESSSWNSQSALLKSALNKKHPHHHKRRSRSLLTSIRCINCSCNDNKSVDIDVTTTSPKASLNSVAINKAELNPWIMKQIQTQKMDETGRGFRKEEGFTFPVLSSKLEISPQENEILPKKPLAMERKKHSLNLDRRTAVLPWNPNAGIYDEDSESDASSDLFEIEDIRSNGKGSFLYAPSEASIEWSVVTASAADFEELVMPAEEEDSGGYKMRKETEKRRSGGILSGCKSQKAVMVAGDAYRTNRKEKAFPEQRMAYRSDSFGRGTRFQAEARKSSFDSKNKHYSFDIGALSR